MATTCPMNIDVDSQTQPTMAGALAMMGREEDLLNKTQKRRQMAVALLQSLMTAKADCESQLRKFKRTDAMLSVTGHSAFDSAIVSTRNLIEKLDRALVV